MTVSRLICWGAVEACGVFDDMGWLCESMVWCWSCRRNRVGVLCLVVSGGVDECWSDIDGDVGIVGDDCRFNVSPGLTPTRIPSRSGNSSIHSLA